MYIYDAKIYDLTLLSTRSQNFKTSDRVFGKIKVSKYIKHKFVLNFSLWQTICLQDLNKRQLCVKLI